MQSQRCFSKDFAKKKKELEDQERKEIHGNTWILVNQMIIQDIMVKNIMIVREVAYVVGLSKLHKRVTTLYIDEI